MGAQNGIIGEDYGINLPETAVQEQDLTNEKNMARFSKTAEFQKLKDHFNGRILFYQTYLPDGRELVTSMPTQSDWIIANAIIGEFKTVLAAYEQAREVVDDAVQRKGA